MAHMLLQSGKRRRFFPRRCLTSCSTGGSKAWMRQLRLRADLSGVSQGPHADNPYLETKGFDLLGC